MIIRHSLSVISLYSSDSLDEQSLGNLQTRVEEKENLIKKKKDKAFCN